MEKYRRSSTAIMKMAFLDIMSYKMNIISIILSHILDLVLNIYLWKFILLNKESLYGYTVEDMYIYISLAIVLNSFFNTPRRLPSTVSHDIISGSIASKLIYPIDYYDYYWWYCIGRGAFFLLFVGMPLLLISLFLFGTWYSMSFVKIMLLIVSVILGYFIETSIAMIVCGIVFWTEKSGGLIAVATFFAYFFSGRLIPIDFFPQWLKFIVDILPYKFAIYTPISIYLDRVNGIEQICGQAIWLIVLVIFGKMIFKTAYSKVEIAGG